MRSRAAGGHRARGACRACPRAETRDGRAPSVVPLGILRSASSLVQERLAALEAGVREAAMARRSLLVAVRALAEPLALATSQSARAETRFAWMRVPVGELVYSLATLVQSSVNSVRPSIPNLKVVIRGTPTWG